MYAFPHTVLNIAKPRINRLVSIVLLSIVTFGTGRGELCKPEPNVRYMCPVEMKMAEAETTLGPRARRQPRPPCRPGDPGCVAPPEGDCESGYVKQTLNCWFSQTVCVLPDCKQSQVTTPSPPRCTPGPTKDTFTSPTTSSAKRCN